MASSKANEACTSTSTSQVMSMQEKKPNTKGSTSSNSNMEKALVKRALFGSRHHRHGGGRRNSNSGVRSLPSRLSKVSLADEQAD
uniref:Uncharacterized protein n=1 Tax=Cannabis sativa TaxID=3483 RepID=A0A803Q4Y8_CANSA